MDFRCQLGARKNGWLLATHVLEEIVFAVESDILSEFVFLVWQD